MKFEIDNLSSRKMSFIRIKVRLKMKSESNVKNTIFGKQRLEIQYFGKGQNRSRVGCTYVSSKEIDIKWFFSS